MLTPAQRAHLASIGKIGGLSFAAQNDTALLSASGRDAFDKTFADGHSCTACPPVVIPVELPEPERARRGAALRRLHFTRIARRRRKS